jgi:hypothetical protein
MRKGGLEYDTRGGESIKVGRSRHSVAIGTETIGPYCIERHEQDIGRRIVTDRPKSAEYKGQYR